MFFSEEKNQKTFTIPPVSTYQAMAGKLALVQKVKVFWAFFSEKSG